MNRRFKRSYLMLLVSTLVLILGCGRSDSTEPSREVLPLVGVWELDSYTVTDSEGLARFPYGQDPTGQLIYTEDGRMSAQMMRADFDLTSFAAMGGDIAVQEIGLSAFFAYWGEFSVDKGAGTVTHHIAGSLYSDWVGAEQLRNYRFDDEDTLVLWAQLPGVSDPDDLYELVWRRVP
jgi:hypothetical protein